MEATMKVVDARNSTAPVAETTAPITRSLFPVDAQAVIYKPARSTMMSAPKRKEEWRLQFERRTPLRIEPLMGWTEDDYPLAQVEMSFRSAEAAIAYARRQGLQYIVVGSPSDDPQGRPVANKDAVVRQQISDTDPRRRKLEWLERALQPNLMVSSGSTGARTNQLRPAAPIKAGGRGGEPQLVAAS
jgi:ETC complex I subunit conserved region